MTLGKLVSLIRDESKRMIINVNGRSEMGGVGVSVCARGTCTCTSVTLWLIGAAAVYGPRRSAAVLSEAQFLFGTDRHGI